MYNYLHTFIVLCYKLLMVFVKTFLLFLTLPIVKKRLTLKESVLAFYHMQVNLSNRSTKGCQLSRRGVHFVALRQ